MLKFLILFIGFVLISGYVIYLVQSDRIDDMNSGRDSSNDFGGPAGQDGNGGD